MLKFTEILMRLFPRLILKLATQRQQVRGHFHVLQYFFPHVRCYIVIS
jgi:hypothetical protein